jgi:poly(3-hydroxybutyrate) depolymerase
MSKKSRRPKGRSKKWSRANVLNYVAGAFVAVSMILGSVFVFGGVTPQSSAPPVTPTIATSTPVPVIQENATPTPAVSPTPAPPTPTP